MFRKVSNVLYNVWCVFWLVGIFLLLFPFIFLCIQVRSLHRWGTELTHLWADIFFFISGLWPQIEYRYKPDTEGTYIFVANHFSYLDIAIGMKVVRNYFSYMGKSSVRKVPLLGYLFRKLHIEVNRSDRKSRARSLRQSIEVLRSGRSLFIMPEGGIVSTRIPEMHLPLKDGAFVLSKDTGIPIIPISFLNLYEIMPSSTVHWDFPHVIIHEPIYPGDKTVEELKEEVYTLIQKELYAYRSRNDKESSEFSALGAK
jgi:1-acyl-sn-glycerol-3-phosphate acyltransferase